MEFSEASAQKMAELEEGCSVTAGVPDTAPFYAEVKRRKRNAQWIGRLCIALCSQPTGAPLVDKGWTRELEPPFRECESRVILLAPWRKNKWGEHLHQKAIAIGWARKK